MVTQNKTKSINYYLDLPWTYTIETTRETGQLLYIVHVNELPGIATDASTLEEAMVLIKEAMRGAFKLYLKQREEIPEPVNPDKSGLLIVFDQLPPGILLPLLTEAAIPVDKTNPSLMPSATELPPVNNPICAESPMNAMLFTKIPLARNRSSTAVI